MLEVAITPCKRGHTSGRYISRACKDCAKENAKKEGRAAAKAKYYRANKVKAMATITAWRAANLDKVDAHRRKAVGHPEPTRPMPTTCEACGKSCSTGRRLALDHCYKTGKFRGWLCMKCNTGIGKLGDDITNVRLALEYLERAS